jgi:hypothetical protein
MSMGFGRVHNPPPEVLLILLRAMRENGISDS